jgi:hypothetical protein
MSDESLLASIRERIKAIAPPDVLADFDKLVKERGRIDMLPDAPPISTVPDDSAFLADNGYPSDAELERIKNWPVGSYNSYEDLFEYISDRWWPDGDPGPRDNGRYRFATGGWSGNEDLISALEGNGAAWILAWQESRRGGLHIFQIPEHLKGEK